MVTTLQKSSITKRNIRTIISDPEKTTNAVNLVYVRDTQPGIKKVKHGRDSIYVLKNKPVKNPKILSRIKSLVILPAGENVKCSSLP